MRRRTTTKRKTVSKTPIRRKRTTTRKKGLLSEMFNPIMAQASAKVVLSGAVGGFSAGFLDKVLPAKTTPEMRSAYMFVGGFLTATALKMPNVGAGMAGVGMFTLLKNKGFLNEGGEISYAENIEMLPEVLNDDSMYLQDDSMYLQDNSMYLQDDSLSYDVGYYGAGFGMDNVNF
jgi:hypothetical protein